MKNGYGSPMESNPTGEGEPMISQYKWRIAGGACLVICAVMAVASLKLATPDTSVWVLVAYWGLFLLFLMIALYVAVLDFRYTQMRYKMTEKELFRDTFMTPEFKQAIQTALKEEAESGKD